METAKSGIIIIITMLLFLCIQNIHGINYTMYTRMYTDTSKMSLLRRARKLQEISLSLIFMS